MTTVVAIYTGQGLAEPLKAVFNEAIPDCRLVNIIDDSLIADVVSNRKVTTDVTRRLLRYYEIAAEMGADVILNTCSSVGEVVALGRQVVDVPIVRIDEPMAVEAVTRYERIGVIATLPSTLQPTLRLLREQAAQAGRAVTLIEGLAAGAYTALVNGSPEQHDHLILETALQLKPQVECLVLAQGSMARMERQLAEATGLPVLSSPRLGVEEVKRVLAGNESAFLSE
jgi:Asp/Glu/hydantoin racemase